MQRKRKITKSKPKLKTKQEEKETRLKNRQLPPNILKCKLKEVSSKSLIS